MLKNTITKLIKSKQEGTYWDFKKCWHDKNGDLLHDILCMANNIDNREAYIIIGVDEENNFNFIDISNDKNRKNTQKIVDFIRSKKFASPRPLVRVETFQFIKNITTDVIVISKGNHTPYYLSEQYEKVRKYYISSSRTSSSFRVSFRASA